MVTYYELDQTNFSSLDGVATDFETLVRRWDLNETFQGEVVIPLQASGWSGTAADAAVTQLTAARRQIDDAFDETSAIAKALRDAHDQFSAAQRTLRQIQEDAVSEKLIVASDGSVSWTPHGPTTDPNLLAEYTKEMQPKAEALAARITAVLAQATQADQEAAAALSGDTGTSTTSFNAKPVGGITELEAQQAATLLSKGNSLSDAQVTQLDALLKAHANDPRFTTAFYSDLGPNGFITSYGALAEGAYFGSKNRQDTVTEMQSLLGTALATATNTQSWPHLSDAWEAGLRKAGATQYNLLAPRDSSGAPYGYQVLSNILRTGNYDPHFLDPIAEHMTQLSEADPTRWDKAISNADPSGMLGLLGVKNQGGLNPMSGMLEGLGHSPDAATAYFHNPATRYSTDGTPLGPLAAASDGSNGYLNALTNTSGNSILLDPSVPNSFLHGQMVGSGAPGTLASTALGHALEAATTGRAYDAVGGMVPPHTADEASVMSQVVDKFGGNSDLIHGDNAPFASMSTSLGHMTASYIGDVDRSISNTSDHLSVFGASAGLDKASTIHLLDTLGRDPNAYGIVTQAQNAYTASQLQNVVHQGIHDPNLGNNLNTVAGEGGKINGILSNARANEVAQQGWQADDQYNQAIDRNADIAKTVWSVSIGNKVGEVPVAGDIANDQVSKLIDNIAQGYHHDSNPQIVTTNIGITGSGETAAGEAARLAVSNALQGSGVPNAADLADNARAAGVSGYDNGLALNSSIHQGGK